MAAKEPTKAQIKEVWEGCGLKTTYKDEVQYWYAPDGTPISKGFWEWCPAIDLNNLVLYAVPFTLEALAKRGYAPPLMKLFQLWYDKLVSLAGDSNNTEYAALALFWVIWEVINANKKEVLSP